MGPTGPWRLDETEDGCRISRPYGNEVTIGFQSNVSANALVLDVRAPSEQLPFNSLKMPVTTEPANRKMSLPYTSYGLARLGWRMSNVVLDLTAIEAVERAQILTVHKARLHVTGISTALKAVTTCAGKLLISWGADPKPFTERSLPEVASNLSMYFGATAYPDQALRAKIQGRVVTLLSLAPDGNVTTCKVVQTANPILDDQTCRNAMHIRFRAAGKGVASANRAAGTMGTAGLNRATPLPPARRKRCPGHGAGQDFLAEDAGHRLGRVDVVEDDPGAARRERLNRADRGVVLTAELDDIGLGCIDVDRARHGRLPIGLSGSRSLPSRTLLKGAARWVSYGANTPRAQAVLAGPYGFA